jgi:hypothetical protein
LRLTVSEAGVSLLLTGETKEALADLSRAAARLAFAGVIVLSPFRARILLDERPLPPVFGDYRNYLLFWNEIFILAVFAFWAMSLCLQPRRLDFGPLIIRLAVIGLAAAVGLSIPFSVDQGLSLYNAIIVLAMIGLAFYVLNELESVWQVVPAVAAMVVLQSIVAIHQVIAQDGLGLGLLGEPKLDPDLSSVSIIWTQDSPRLLRAYGLSDHPNILGGVLAFSLLVLGTGLARVHGTASTLLSVVFGLGVAALALTFSRSAVLSLVAGLGLVFVLLLARQQWHALSLWLAACLGAVLIVVPLLTPYQSYLSARINPTSEPEGGTEERAISERQALARNTNEIFLKHPLVGVGLGALPTAMFHAYPNFRYHYSPAHIAILVAAAETGLFGAFAYGVLLLTPWVVLWWQRERVTPELIGVSAAFLALAVVGLLDYYTWSFTSGRIWFWLILGLWLVEYRRSLNRTADA